MTIEIQLSKGYVALVDDIDSYLADMKWHARPNHKTVYASRNIYPNGKTSAIWMHRIVLERMLGCELTSLNIVDHRDMNGLNNTRSNLRLATTAQNNINRSPSVKSQTGISGVYWEKHIRKWRAQMKVNGRNISLGVFDNFDDAKAARIKAEIEQYGEFSPHWKPGC